MFFKSKKSENKQRVKKFKVNYRPIKVQVGLAVVEIVMEDGRKFDTTIYGDVNQDIPFYVGSNRPAKIAIIRGSEKARRFMTTLSKTPQTFVNDPKDINRVMIGIPVSASLVYTDAHEVDFQEAYLEQVYE